MMEAKNRTLLTMEERLRLAAKSQASSSEAAAGLVRRLSKIPTIDLFAGRGDLDLMHGLTGAYWEDLGDDLLHYAGFCRSFLMALENDFEPQIDLKWRPAPLCPLWGARVSNAIVLLGLILLDHAKGRWKNRAIYHCTQMTLGQYLDALADLACPGDAMPDPQFHSWQGPFLERCDRSMPLGDTLADVLHRYIAGWQELDHLDHVLRCMGALACYLEDVSDEPLSQEEAERIRRFREALCQYDPGLEGWELLEADKRYPDPHGYYFCLAYEYPDHVPDLGGKGVSAQAVRSQVYLSGRDYCPDALKKLAALSPSPDLRVLLEKCIAEDRLVRAMREIDTAVMDLCMMWVGPYLRLEGHHCKMPLAEEPGERYGRR